MTELLKHNLSIISKRWPDLVKEIEQADPSSLDACVVDGLQQTISVNGLQLSSRHNREQEAEQLCEHLPDAGDCVHVYGVGMGDMPIYLLETGRFAQIVVHLMNVNVFALLITHTDQSQWLKHPKINIKTKPEINQPLSPNIALSADMTLCDYKYAIVRDLLMYELNRQHVNSNRSLRADKYQQHLFDNQRNLQSDPDICAMKPAFQCAEAFVIGAGPSLEESYQLLEKISHKPKRQRPVIIAVDTAIKGLNHAGVKTDIAITLDELITAEIIDAVSSQNQALVYFPTSSPELIDNWQGQKFNACSNLPRDKEIAQAFHKTKLFCSGSVIHPATHLAIFLGATSITFFGADFGYPQQKCHAYQQPDVITPTFESIDNKINNHWVLNGKGEKLPTALNLRAYLRALEQFISQYPKIRFFRASLEGAQIQGTEYRQKYDE